ncbi:MAG: NAD(P)/FAD-dependent oxidoreductase [Roseiflexaceae bacterium]
MRTQASVVIIGAGVMGASVACHLAMRGCTDVVILEQFETEIQGSTARSAAGVRHQFSHELNVRMSQYGIERFKHFREEIGGESGLHQVGYLFLINDQENWQGYCEATAMQNRLGVRTQLLKPADVHAIVPDVRIDDLIGATFGPDDGYCDPHGVALGYLTRARSLGVELLRATPATGIEVQSGRVVAVQTPHGRIACETIINCAGSWAGQAAALAGLTVPIQPFRRNIYVTQPTAIIPNQMPLTVDVTSGFWMRKEQDNLIFGLSKADEPAGYNTNVDWDWLDTVLDAGFDRFPRLGEVQLADKQCWAGAYEITPDHMPILGRHPDMPSFINAAGFSGHGIMHSPATGVIIAEEVLDGRSHTFDIDPLRIERYATGSAFERNII